MSIPTAMRVPKNRQSRMSDDVWIASEAIARFFGMTNTRDGLETAVRDYVTQMSKSNQNFAEIWEEVKKEGIESSK